MEVEKERKKITKMTRVDCQRLKRNFAYWLWRYNGQSREEFVKNAPAVLYHHFNEHKYCDPVWCPHHIKDETALAQ